MTKFRSIFWHRRDLRIEDNIGLFEASKNSKNLIGLYVLDPNLLNLNLEIRTQYADMHLCVAAYTLKLRL